MKIEKMDFIFVIFMMRKNQNKMIKLNKDKVQLKYITGINKCISGYPTPLDVLYDSCVESVDDNLFSLAKIQNRYEVDEERANKIIDALLNLGYIEKNNSRYKIIKTIWQD